MSQALVSCGSVLVNGVLSLFALATGCAAPVDGDRDPGPSSTGETGSGGVSGTSRGGVAGTPAGGVSGTSAGGGMAGASGGAAGSGGAARGDASAGEAGTGPSRADSGAAERASLPDALAGDAVARAEARPAAGKVPANLLDLTNWKLTLPVKSPFEVKQPELATFSLVPYFYLDAGGWVVFRANCGGATTSNSEYPRSELREMTSGGKSNASWSTTSGTHTMIITQAITQTPVAKPHVVAGQIHDADDDLVMIRLEGSHLFVEANGRSIGDLDRAYKLGTKFVVKLEASGGHVRVSYNDLATPKVDYTRSASGCYFKAGVYTQSNTSTGDSASAYGEVHVYDLKVTHQ